MVLRNVKMWNLKNVILEGLLLLFDNISLSNNIYIEAQLLGYVYVTGYLGYITATYWKLFRIKSYKKPHYLIIRDECVRIRITIFMCSQGDVWHGTNRILDFHLKQARNTVFDTNQ